MGFRKGADKKPSKEEELIKRVDAMMDPKLPDAPQKSPNPVADPASQPTPPPLDIFKDTKTAPEIPTEQVKKAVEAPEALTKTAPTLSNVVTPTEPTPAASPDPQEKVDTSEKIVEAPLLDESNASIENPKTDKAVEEIVAEEGDALLAAQDAVARKANHSMQEEPGLKAKLQRLLKSKKTWAVVLVVLVLLFAIPYTRYKILSVFIKKQVTISIIDSKTDAPVSNAEIQVSGKQFKTDGEGEVRVELGVGPNSIEVKKQYYKTQNKSVFVGIRDAQNPNIDLEATGRQVPISVGNKITGQPVANAEVRVANTSVRTDKKGKATIVLPAAASSESAIITAKGFNDAKQTVRITNDVVPENNFMITPVGKVYFLSNQSGKIDVIRSNLDGSDRKVIVDGTGREEPNNTVLLASRDWRYLLLKSRRDGAQPALYLINTAKNEVDPIDTSNSDFELIGWYGHNFMYSATNRGLAQGQSDRQIIKSYDADRSQPLQLDQSKAEGNANTYGYQVFDNFRVLDNLLTYTTQWNTYDATGASFNLANKNDAIRTVQPNGQNKKDLQTFPSTGMNYIQSAQYGPQSIYYSVYNGTNGQTAYYQLDNQTVVPVKSIDQSDLNKVYPTYLASPAGTEMLWSDVRDGKYTLFVGDNKGKNPRQIPSAGGDYAPYGWYSNDLILVSKGNNQLYVMPATGLKEPKQPLKVTNYYRPTTVLTGYGYGGL